MKRYITQILNALSGALVGVLFILVVDLSVQYLSPSSWWINYKGLHSEGYIIEGGLEMMSTTGYPRGGDITFIDTLWCESSGLYSLEKTELKNFPQTKVTTQKWLYKGELPPEGTECELRTNLTVETPFGFKKLYNVISNIFNIRSHQ